MSIQQQIDMITSPQVSQVISQGMAQIYLNQPNFPITYLAVWLKQFSSSRKTQQQLINKQKTKRQKYEQLQRLKQTLQDNIINQNSRRSHQVQLKDQEFQSKVTQTKHLNDLLKNWLPEFIEKTYNFTGAYVGKLDFDKKPIEQGNFELGAQNDTENPKIISYIGASSSHSALMNANVLRNGKGISYDVFEQAPEQNNDQGQVSNLLEKKTYLYVKNVLKEARLHYFKYPKLGAYVCFPIKIKSCLNVSTLNKGIVEYKVYLKNKEQTEKQYQEKLNQTRTEAQDATKKLEDFELNEEDPASHEQKKVLQGQADLANQKLQELIKNKPVVEQVLLDTIQRNLFMACDTLGQDTEIAQDILQKIDSKVKYFISQWQAKQKNMILSDILTFLQDELQLQNAQILLQEHQKNIISNYQSQIKEQFTNKERQAEYQLSLIKCEKTRQLLHQNNLKNSMQVYLNYNVPKFTELIQVWCMLLGLKKEDINSDKSNQLDYRKIINRDSFKNLLEKLDKYQLRREQSSSAPSQHKINKILQRLEKIDVEALSKYNAFLFMLHYLLKTYCWARILCRDAKKQIFQAKTKLKQDRENQILKWMAQIQKNLQTAKAELDEQGQQNFQEQQWRKNYQQENAKPEPLQAPLYKQFLDIE